MSTETTTTSKKDLDPIKPRKRASKKAPNDLLGQKRAELAAKAKELNRQIKVIEKDLAYIEKTHNALAAALLQKTSERDRVIAGREAIDKTLTNVAKKS